MILLRAPWALVVLVALGYVENPTPETPLYETWIGAYMLVLILYNLPQMLRQYGIEVS